jgi:hypothetical protein
MSLDGLRAWIGEVERKLGMRTRVFLALSVIAIGGAGAAIYLAVDAHNKTVSESDLQALQRQLEGQMGTGGETGSTTAVAQLEAEVKELKQQVEGLTGEEGGSAGEKGAGSATEGGTKEGGASGSSGSGAGSGSGSGSTGPSGNKEASSSSPESSDNPTPTTSSGSSRLKELLEEAKGK